MSWKALDQNLQCTNVSVQDCWKLDQISESSKRLALINVAANNLSISTMFTPQRPQTFRQHFYELTCSLVSISNKLVQCTSKSEGIAESSGGTLLVPADAAFDEK
jgi:hypothetical protein